MKTLRELLAAADKVANNHALWNGLLVAMVTLAAAVQVGLIVLYLIPTP